MKKIGTITFSWAHNYGALLQTYALEKKLEQFGDVRVIDFKKEQYVKMYKVLTPLNGNINKKLKILIKNVLYFSKNYCRYKNFKNFINKNINFSRSFYSEEDLKKNAPNYDIYITGSDQVWNPKIVGELSDAYTLNFGNSNVIRISYAASVGDASQIKYNKEIFKEKLSHLDCISVRENDAKIELDRILDNDVSVVLDPTLLLTREEWSKVIKGNKEKEKYILAYVVEEDIEYNKIVNELSKKTGLKVIHFEKRGKKYNNVLKSAYTADPFDFVNYIKNAEYVVATSFHATVFSIIFNKKFFIIPHRKTGARVTNLLDKLEIKGRTFSNIEEFENINYNFETNWEEVNKKLNIERKKSINWLSNALNYEKGEKNE